MKAKYNMHDWVLLGAGVFGAGLLVYGLMFDNVSKCDSTLYGIKTNDSTIIAAIIFLGAIFYKSIAKWLKNKFGGAK